MQFEILTLAAENMCVCRSTYVRSRCFSINGWNIVINISVLCNV